MMKFLTTILKSTLRFVLELTSPQDANGSNTDAKLNADTIDIKTFLLFI